MTTLFEHVYAEKPDFTQTQVYTGYSHLPEELAHKVFRMGVGVKFPDLRRKWSGAARLSEDLAWYIDAEGKRVDQPVVDLYMGQWSLRSLGHRHPMRMALRNILHPEVYQRQVDRLDQMRARHWEQKILPIVAELRDKFPEGICDSRGRHFRAHEEDGGGWSMGSRAEGDLFDPLGDRCFQVWNRSSDLLTARDEAMYRLYYAVKAHLPAPDEDPGMLEAVVKVQGLGDAVHLWKCTRQQEQYGLSSWVMEPWTARIDLEFSTKEGA